ncbi:MAG: tRNA 2-thiouridine(34) synthase MnmA [bacterium]|nr:tRNA 2-thiouridine(34) synthase MnmA [bacterium]
MDTRYKIQDTRYKAHRVFVALSGGVDSSVTAFLLKKAGYDISCVFMRFWRNPRFPEENPCCSLESETRARILAKSLKAPFFIFDFEKEFKEEVVDYFLERTGQGFTPNPCVVCNQEIKFGLFLKKSLKMGADFVATGHYARIARHQGFQTPDVQIPARFGILRARPVTEHKSVLCSDHADGAARVVCQPYVSLLKAKDREKDQSYFLWRLSQKQLSRTLFPVGDYTKTEVRKLASRHKLAAARTKDSQNLCFLAGETAEFLKNYLKGKAGAIVDSKSKIIGRHPGLGFFTIGQRQGIVANLFPKEQSRGPFYVLKKDLKRNTLIVTTKEKDLFKKELIAARINWIFGRPPKLPLKVKARIRSRQKEVEALISEAGKRIRVNFKKPERAITPGQSIVFYKGEELLGGGVIL